MYLASLAGAVGFAALGQAFLVPPTLSPHDASATAPVTVPVEHTFEVESRSFLINCRGCSVALPDAAGVTHDVANLESKLMMNFTIAHDTGNDRLLLNGVDIYPSDASMASFFDPITAQQLIRSPVREKFWDYVAEPKIGYRMRTHRPPTSNNELDLVVLEFQIIEVGGHFVQDMPEFVIKLLETPSEKLRIGDISSARPHHPVPAKGGKECQSILCKWRDMIAGKIAKPKGCGRKSGKIHHLNHDGISSHRNHGHHGFNGQHRHHRHHNKHHAFIRFVKGIALHVLIPIAIGIVVGMTASMVGFVAATFIVFVWRLLFRRNRSAAYDEVPQEETDAEESEKSKIALQEEEHVDAPPVYEEVEQPKA